MLAMARKETSEQLPTNQTVISQGEGGVLRVQHDASIPKVEPDMVLVKNVAVAMNPCDWKMPTNLPCPGARDGCDFAGPIVQIGSAVTRNLSIGSRVCGAIHASNPDSLEAGSFAQYTAAYADLLVKIPDDMPWENAAAIGGGVVGTLGLALFQSLDLPAHPEKPAIKSFYVLVYGASTSSGTMAIQLLRCSGLKVIATCSPQNFDLVKSYGAEEVFDYNSPTCAKDIRAYTRNSLKYVLDTITEVKTMKLCYAAIGRAGGKYTGLELLGEDVVSGMRKTVKNDWVLGIRLTGKKIALSGGYGYEASPELREFGRQWFATVERLLHDGRIRSHPPQVNRGGFQGILEGVDMLRRREVSGKKLVYFIPEE